MLMQHTCERLGVRVYKLCIMRHAELSALNRANAHLLIDLYKLIFH